MRIEHLQRRCNENHHLLDAMHDGNFPLLSLTQQSEWRESQNHNCNSINLVVIVVVVIVVY
jgi:hypothetical protein